MDTIVASASPWGRSAVAVLRLSGPEAREIAERLCPDGPVWKPRRASVRRAVDGDLVIDSVLAIWMPGPRSYTGEDVVELSCHGNPVIVEQLLERSISWVPNGPTRGVHPSSRFEWTHGFAPSRSGGSNH